jgi:hypothetical protein
MRKVHIHHLKLKPMKMFTRLGFIALILFVMFSCTQPPELGGITNVLLEHKTKTENYMHLFAENCGRNKSTYNQGVKLYNKVQTKHNQLINKLTSDIRQGQTTFNHSNVETELGEMYARYYEYVDHSLQDNCRPPMHRSVPLPVIIGVAELAITIYQNIQLQNQAVKESAIQELKSLEIRPYYEILN